MPQTPPIGARSATQAQSKVIEITPIAMNYDWGRTGAESEVAQLYEATGHSVDPATPFAELWMGTHPSGPSTMPDGVELLAHIRDNPEVLGSTLQTFGADLPFLFKILSVRTALSIQSHPDKMLAERLHADRPQIYKDSNHKPEMAVALSDFEALCGFAPHEEICEAMKSTPELVECCGSACCNAYIESTPDTRQSALKAAFTTLMTQKHDVVSNLIGTMVARLQSARNGGKSLTTKESLVVRLNEQYPGDVGVMSVWFLNFLTLKRGQAIALAANEPHAYVSGEIVECMATSDNVIRAGLTPKLRDTDVLCASLTYSQEKPQIMEGEKDDARHLKFYRPPFEEFEVAECTPPACTALELGPAMGPMILLIQRGSGELRVGGATKNLARGSVLFVPAGTPLQIEASTDMVAWFAAANRLGL